MKYSIPLLIVFALTSCQTIERTVVYAPVLPEAPPPYHGPVVSSGLEDVTSFLLDAATDLSVDLPSVFSAAATAARAGELEGFLLTDERGRALVLLFQEAAYLAEEDEGAVILELSEMIAERDLWIEHALSGTSRANALGP